ncbi:MAG TPA: GAF domain-containing protein [Roseiflexaceae bacterium]|nr:GAF domain-containing protein [Roseiflexaceae bacterium]
MAHPLPVEAGPSPLFGQLSTDLSQARSLDDAAKSCVQLLRSALTPQSCQLVWGNGPASRLLGYRAGKSIVQPDERELSLLRADQLALRTEGEQVLACFIPLRARGELLGWFYLDQPIWGTDSPALLAMVAAQAAPALAMLDAVARREDRVDQLRTLNEIGRLLSGVLDPDSLLDAIFNATRRLVDAPIFYIAFYDEGRDELELTYVLEDGVRQPARERWTADIGLAGLIVRDRQPIRADDYTTECHRRGVRPRPFAGLRGARAWLGVPLLAHDRLIGIMSVATYREGYTYSDEHVEVLLTIAAQASVAIENARLYQQSARQARQLATLNQIGRNLTSSLDPERVPALIIEQVTELLNVEEGSLLLAEQSTGDLVFAYTTGPFGQRLLGQRIPRGTGLAGYVFEHGQSVVVNDVQSDERFDNSTDKTSGFVTRAILAVPLRGVGGVHGVIEALNRRDGGQFTVEDQQLLEALADQAVIALENARRFAQVDQALARRAQELVRTNDRLQHNLRSLTALNALGMAINTTLRGADEIFGMTARGVVEMTGALGAAAQVPDEYGFRPAVQIGPALPASEQLSALLRQVIASGRPEMLQSGLPASLTQIGARALLIVPLRATQRTLGALCVYYAEAAPDAPNQETVVLFATQAAVAVESIEFLTAVRSGRDQMASILASTREGIMLITPDARVAIANSALHQLCGLAPQMPQNMSVEAFLRLWEEKIAYSAEEWAALRQGLAEVIAGRQEYATGELNERSAHPRAVEWAALTALSSGASNGGALLVLRDITEAKESERLRQDLTNMIVHDLRSPLSSVMASIELMTKGVAGELPAQQRNVLTIAYNSAVQMLEMINALLDISRLESGRLPLELKACSVRPLIDRAVERLASLAQERNMLIQYDIPDTLAPALADEALIVRVAQNLLGNALKFSGRGSTVLIRALYVPADRATETEAGVVASPDHSLAPSDRGLIRVAVIDCGVGIAPEDQEKIFAKFGQVGERRGGSGLGLTFCKLVVEAHGGQIWVESTVGEGSTFFFTIPTAG